MSFEASKASLFKDTETLPSLVCRRRFLDAMLVQRDLKLGASEFAKRIAPEDQNRLVRDRLYLLKKCLLNGKDADAKSEPYLYNLH
jgi:hypothetical protein